MKKTLIVLLGLSLVAAPSISSAQQGQGPRRGQGLGPGQGQGQGQGLQQRRGPHGLPPSIALLFDTDKNEVLSNTEVGNAPALLLALDANDDGVVTGGELCVRAALGEEQCPIPQGLQRGKRRGANAQLPTPASGRGLLALFDVDKDGNLSGTEIANSSGVLATLDANQDGQLTKDELRPMPGCEPGQGRGMGRRGAGAGTGDCPFQN